MSATRLVSQLMPDNTVDTGMPGFVSFFFFIFAIVFIGGIVISIVKFKATRDMAIRKGATETEATAVALSGDIGTSAAFIKPGAPAGPRTPTRASAPAGPRPAADRIREVRELQAQGLITPEQADARVADILGTI